MRYPYMTLADETEISHSSMGDDGIVRVYIETPCEGGFHHAECILPGYQWKDIQGYPAEKIQEFDSFLHHNAHMILELAQAGGFAHATAV